MSFGRSRLRAHAKRVHLRSSKEFFLRHLSLEKTRFNADTFPKNLTAFGDPITLRREFRSNFLGENAFYNLFATIGGIFPTVNVGNVGVIVIRHVVFTVAAIDYG